MDQVITQLQHRVRSYPLLYRLTLGTRILLAAGFIPTGLVKLLGLRFTSMSVDSPIGAFFDVLYQSGLYWRFLGLAQLLAGLLVLFPGTALLGAVLFFPIILNIFVITLAYDFNGTPVVTGLMLLANLYLLGWDYHRLRGILVSDTPNGITTLSEHRLSGPVERAFYVAGALTGIGLFSGLRNLLPWSWNIWFLLAAFGCALAALAFGIANRKRSPAIQIPA
jgi:hypothetical protein